jgi:hypothetical protein
MRYHTITFHLTETQATITTTAFSWLSSQNLSWTSTSRMNLILDHVLQSLVVSWTKEDHNFHFLACKAIVHNFIAPQLIAKTMKLIRNPFNSITIAAFASRNSLEGCCITFSPSQRRYFRMQTFNQMTNSHTRGDSMRIDNKIRNNPFLCKRHIFLSVSHSNSTFLAMT